MCLWFRSVPPEFDGDGRDEVGHVKGNGPVGVKRPMDVSVPNVHSQDQE